ncbi:MAG TPA: site-specific integrase [Prosthecobacter sp.]|nr:site-specific integrase [Prosthecobacter sp.]
MGRPKGSYSTPAYRLHKASGRAVVTISGKDFYLGPYGSTESRREYDRLIAEWLVRGRQSATPQDKITIAEILVAYLANNQPKIRSRYDVAGNCLRDSEWYSRRTAATWLTTHYADVPAKDFGPVALVALRTKMQATVTAGKAQDHVRRRGALKAVYVNRICDHIIMIFRWAAEMQLIDSGIYHSLKLVKRLKKDSERVKPVDDKHVDAVLAIAPPTVGAMIRVQILTGARPGEVCMMRGCDIDMSGPVWKYTPRRHKTEHRGQSRVIFIGPECQKVIRPFLKADVQSHLFSARDTYYQKMTRVTQNRKHKRSRCEGREPIVPPSIPAFYRSDTYSRCIRQQCDRADRLAHKANPSVPKDVRIVARWHPHQLRHNAGTYLRAEFGLETARAVLGHKSAAVTEIYAERDWTVAEKVMGQVG